MTIIKKYTRLLSAIILVSSIYVGFSSVIPSVNENEDSSLNGFSMENALRHLKQISKEPHFTGSIGHKKVRDYIVLELERMGLDVMIQEQMAMGPKHRSTVKTKNILAKIKGSEKGNGVEFHSHRNSLLYSDPSTTATQVAP